MHKIKNIFSVFLIIAIVLASDAMGWPFGKMTTKTAQATTGVGQPVVAIHFVMAPFGEGRPALPIADAMRLVDMAHAASFNTIVVQLANGMQVTSSPELSRYQAWTKAEWRTFIAYANANGLKVVPEIKLLTHQEKFLASYFPNLMFNRSTYDPRNEAVYDLVFAYLDEVIDVFEPEAINIGHDEVAGLNADSAEKWLDPGEVPLPAEYFLSDVLRINNYLKSKGVETWMWGDMLLTPDEFPTMKDEPLHGILPGYGKQLRDALPKDIVICDWHYADEQLDYPSLSTMKAEGRRVIGATWKNLKTISNFSTYASQYGADGMIATTWFHVQAGDWDIVNRIVTDSATWFSTLGTPSGSCFDGVQNQNETGVDCGGVCPACVIPPTTYNQTNFKALINRWRQVGNATSDVNADHTVNTKDLGIMMSKWSH